MPFRMPRDYREILSRFGFRIESRERSKGRHAGCRIVELRAEFNGIHRKDHRNPNKDSHLMEIVRGVEIGVFFLVLSKTRKGVRQKGARI